MPFVFYLPILFLSFLMLFTSSYVVAGFITGDRTHHSGYLVWDPLPANASGKTPSPQDPPQAAPQPRQVSAVTTNGTGRGPDSE